MVKLFARDLRLPARVHDLDTKRDVRGVIWVDEEAGSAEAYHYDEHGRKVLTYDVDGAAAWKTVLLKGRFKLLPLVAPQKPTGGAVIMGAPACAKCNSPLTLRGDDLCPACKRRDMGKPLDARRCGPLDFRKCQSCSRDATWSVSDEVVVTPQVARRGRSRVLRAGSYYFDRAATVGRRYYCSWCFKAPRLVDHKGEVISVDDDVIRPDS